MNTKKDVALVLSSGGPRGFAYIGAIEELLARGYRITSVAGCSIGSLVGGVYAAGGLEDFKEWLYSLNHFKVMSLMDFSISRSYLVKGERIIRAIREVVPEVNIESLPIPYAAVAADLYTGEQAVFREGPLFDAIRASISIPSMFRPVKYGHRTLVDGGIVNTFPLDLVERNGHDILVGFDVNDIDAEAINGYLATREEIEDAPAPREAGRLVVLRDSLQKSGLIKEIDREGQREQIPVGADDNYYSILSRTFSIANHVIAGMEIAANPPDVLVRMSCDSFSAIADYSRGREIAENGRELMAAALDRYERS